MRRFKNILVGVDLSWGDRFVSEELSEPNAEAVRQALWLARMNSASVDFFYSMELSCKAQELISESNPGESTVLADAKNRLAELTAMAQEAGVAAESHVAIGKSWLELIRHVLRKQHDLVIVGTRHRSALQGFLLGSTGIKLLRKCPCPVWITQPWAERSLDSILVAHDLRPVGDLAMDLGCSMAELRDAQLHVVHAAEHLDFQHVFPASVLAQREHASGDDAREYIETQLAGVNLTRPAILHFLVDSPIDAIMHCIKDHNIDLLIMGTAGHAGIAGFISGSTAERLLPRISCSLLAVKPPGFSSPVLLDENEPLAQGAKPPPRPSPTTMSWPSSLANRLAP